MPPSGLLPGGLSGFESRYNHMAINVADYCHPYKIRKTSNSSSSGKPRKATTTVAPAVPTAIPASASAAANAVTTPHPMAATAAMKKCSCPGCQQQQPRSSPQKIDPSVGEGGPPKVRNLSSLGTSELSKPLFVDCSVEYELPMVPKIPSDGQPLLVIHPGWQQKRRITRSSSQQRLQMEQQHRMALQQQYHMYCSQCPVQPQPQPQPPRPPPASTATSTSSSRKRSYDSSRGTVSSTAGSMMQYTGYNEPQNQQRSKRARTDPSWLLQCQEQSCIQQQQQQQHQQQQQQHHFMMQQQQQQQQHWLRHQQNWQQQQMNAAGCPLPLPAPPPPVSARMAQAHPTGFYMHHGSQYHQWHPAYFCPPSAVQLQRQQQWLHQQQHHFQQQQQQQQQMVNNNLPFGAFKSGPCCPKCFEGKCHTQQQSMGNPFNPPAPPPALRSQVHQQQQPQPNTTSVRYRSSV